MKTVRQLVSDIRYLQKTMDSQQRKALWSKIMSGYCRMCGDKERGRSCQCWNDE